MAPILEVDGRRYPVPATQAAIRLLDDTGAVIWTLSSGGKITVPGTYPLRQLLIDGVDETGTPTYAVPGMAVGDEIVSVIVYTTKASIATQVSRAKTDFTPGAGALAVGANAANNAANQLLITWVSKTAA